MTVFVNRSIPLSQESRDGWIRAGAIVLSRNNVRRSRQLAGQPANQAEPTSMVLLNLGLADDVPWDGIVYNVGDSVRSVLAPAAIRRTMPDLIPPRTPIEPCWGKMPGQHGEGKHFYPNGMSTDDEDSFSRQGCDIQKHIEGTEFRVITVGNLVVQASRKNAPVNGVRDWTWVGVGGIKQNGIIPLLKRAVELVPNGTRTVFGWDVIVADRPYIIEANSSPGVNDSTARRIIQQIERTLGDHHYMEEQDGS